MSELIEQCAITITSEEAEQIIFIHVQEQMEKAGYELKYATKQDENYYPEVLYRGEKAND